ncbi:flotillin domain-containing protein [Desulfosarcina cetonica]|uniref:flotillin domain-containing protein n=1 Tax=Desulfosarcina cetonica TaxID=90730 RepID=UPI001FEDE8AE|nr:flotillin domain-containing protein [Desulfosarcina cetonica]
MSALDKAEAVRTMANAAAEKVRIQAQGEADSEVLHAEAAEKRYAVEAAGKRAINEADNTLSGEQVAMQVRLALIKYLPAIIRESVKPIEHIDGIKIFQLDGFGGKGDGAEPSSASGTNLADQVVNSALRYRGQAPLVDMLMSEIGLKAGDINGLTQALQQTADVPPAPKETATPEDE